MHVTCEYKLDESTFAHCFDRANSRTPFPFPGCTSGLTKSILNDYVAKKHRAKWNSLESINIFSWSGSAALGGYLVDNVGYRETFLITACIQATSALMLMPLLGLVHREKTQPKEIEDTLDKSAYAKLGQADLHPQLFANSDSG